MDAQAEAFDPAAILEALTKARVRFVVIGGVAVSLQGSALITQDLDIFPASSAANLARLARALIAMDARQFHDPETWVSIDARSLAARKIWEWATVFGKVDLLFEPRGAGTYPAVSRRAASMPVAGGLVRVATLSDLIAMKEAMGRETDRRALLDLRELQSL